MNTPTIANFWAFCLERESIREKKERGGPPPWTEDRILQTYHFCNIRRGDDYGTRWYLDNVVSDEWRDLLWKTVIYRAVNRTEWFEGLLTTAWYEGQFGGGLFGREQWGDYKADIIEAIEKAQAPYSLAYIVLQGPDGQTRKAHLLELINWLDNNFLRFSYDIQSASNLEKVWKILQQAPYVGPFIALQIYRDLILTGSLKFNDNDFVYLGPGCRRGLEMVLDLKDYKQQYLALDEIRKMHPPELELNLGDTEHAMCEARKYWRLSERKGRRRYYHPRTANLASDRIPFG